MKIYSNRSELIGHTPLFAMSRFAPDVTVLAKLEACNPSGSAKDRAATAMILDAEERGLLHAGSVLIEPTSGNTGIGLAAAAAARGYRVILTMPDTMSVERRSILAAFGAELVLTEGARGMAGAIEKADALAAETPGSFVPRQFSNPANPAVNGVTTGPEIWEDTDGTVDIFVAAVGTGGTLSGVGAFLKSKNPAIRIIAVEPASSPVLSGGKAGGHGIQGIGAGFIPENLDVSVYDEVIAVTDEDAYETGRAIARREGLLVGISSGAAAFAAAAVARRPENAGKRVVTLLPDTGERYLSSPMFAGK